LIAIEMGRYRDYELKAATWYSTILVGMLGIGTAMNFGTYADSLKDYARFGPAVLAGLSALIGTASICSIRYVSYRYDKLREIAYEMEPEPLEKRLKKCRDDMPGFTPVWAVIGTQLSIVLITLIAGFYIACEGSIPCTRLWATIFMAVMSAIILGFGPPFPVNLVV